MKNKWLLILSAAFLLLAPYPLKAQIAPAIQWDRSVGGVNAEDVKIIEQSSDGGFVIGGYSGSGISGDKSKPGNGDFDFWLIKLDASGFKVWDWAYGGSHWDIITTMQFTSDGGMILGGQSRSDVSGDKSQPNRGMNDYWIVKIDSLGNKIWDRTFGGNNADYCKVVKQTKDGGYMVGGESWSGISGDKTSALQGLAGAPDFWVLKLDAAGNLIWQKSYGGNGSEYFTSLEEMPDGGFILSGSSNSGQEGDKSQPNKGVDFDFWILKIDSAGIKLWDKSYGGNLSDEMAAMQKTSDWGFALAGTTYSPLSGDKTEPPIGHTDYWLVRTDSLGNKLWDKTVGGTGQENLYAVHQTQDKGFVLGGLTLSGVGGHKSEPSRGNMDMWIVRLDSAGNKLWDKTLGGSDSERLNTIKQTADGGYIAGGSSMSGQSGDKSQPSKGNQDSWIIKLAPEVLSMKEPFTENLTLFPNPTTGIIHLAPEDRKAGQVLVYNTLGQVVFSKQLAKTDKANQFQIDLSKEPKGVYTIHVLSDKQVITRKVVLH